jgi:hypothetical protein
VAVVTTRVVLTPATPVKAVEYADLIREVEEAKIILSGWANRIAATRGDNARFLLTALDNATGSAGRALSAAKTVYPKAAQAAAKLEEERMWQ